MAKNHPSRLLGLGEEMGLWVAGLRRGGLALASHPASVGNGAARQLLKLGSRADRPFQSLRMDTATASQHSGGFSVTRMGSNSNGDTGKPGAWTTCLSPTRDSSSGSHPDDAHSAIPRESSSRWSEARFLAMQQLKISFAKRTATPYEEFGQEEWGRFPPAHENWHGCRSEREVALWYEG